MSIVLLKKKCKWEKAIQPCALVFQTLFMSNYLSKYLTDLQGSLVKMMIFVEFLKYQKRIDFKMYNCHKFY